MLILACDLGTSSTRSALFDAQGVRLRSSTAHRAYPLQTSPDGRAELDPGQVLRAVVQCIDHSHRTAGRGMITAVGMSCFWHSLLGVDAQGQAATPIVTWADSRAAPDATRLRTRTAERGYHQRTGCMLRATFWPAKLRYLRRTRPQLVARVTRWVSPAEWLLEQFTGTGRCAHGMGTATGLYDPARLDWDPASLRLAGVHTGQLNPLSDEPLTLSPAYARRWPRLAGAKWFPGIGDGAASNLGAGALGQGTAAINVGTSAAIRVVRERGRPRAPFGLFCYRIDRRRYLIGGAITNAGSLLAWCRAQLALPGARALEHALARPVGATAGLLVAPLWMGERSPDWRMRPGGAITGITQSTSAVDLVQAITTASYQRLARVAALIPGARGVRLIVGGGILASPASLQRLSDCLGATLFPTIDPELSLRGAAVLALERCAAAPRPPRTLPAVRPRRAEVVALRAQRRRLADLDDLLVHLDPP